MESSSEGRLGMHKKDGFLWKGKTFNEISSVLQKYKGIYISERSKVLFFKPLPIKHYRREIIVIPPSDDLVLLKANFRNSQRIGINMETPGGTVINTSSSSECIVNSNQIYFQMENTKTNKPCSACDDALLSDTNKNQTSKYLKSLSQEDSALRRVRSAGMNRPRYNAQLNNRPESYNSSAQYLQGRNKTFKQNQFNNLRIENVGNTSENIYSSNTIQYCDTTSSNPDTQYVPVYYKPSNSKFAVQGAVDSSSRLVRLKYDTITDVGSKMRKAYGEQTANALSYGVPGNGYTIKDKVGYPNVCTPVIRKYGGMIKCG